MGTCEVACSTEFFGLTCGASACLGRYEFAYEAASQRRASAPATAAGHGTPAITATGAGAGAGGGAASGGGVGAGAGAGGEAGTGTQHKRNGHGSNSAADSLAGGSGIEGLKRKGAGGGGGGGGGSGGSGGGQGSERNASEGKRRRVGDSDSHRSVATSEGEGEGEEEEKEEGEALPGAAKCGGGAGEGRESEAAGAHDKKGCDAVDRHPADDKHAKAMVHRSSRKAGAAEGASSVGDTYCWSACEPPLPLEAIRAHGCPLPAPFVKVGAALTLPVSRLATVHAEHTCREASCRARCDPPPQPTWLPSAGTVCSGEGKVSSGA